MILGVAGAPGLGRSMEEEARLILAQAVAAEEDISLSTVGFGSGIAALFSGAALEEPLRRSLNRDPARHQCGVCGDAAAPRS